MTTSIPVAATATFITQLQGLLETKHLLKHPFYRAWEAGAVPRPVLARYAEQYYHLEKNFPRFLSQTHTNCDDPNVRQVITDNLYDEEHGANNHRELWLRFGESVGATRQSMQESKPLPETAATIATFKRLASASTLAGVAALAAYETQIPAVAKTKIEGLQKHYGVKDDRSLAFWRVHGVLDIDHANAWWDIIKSETVSPESRAAATAALEEARDALWNFLDGIGRAYLPNAMSC